jgi:hypothetical protein
MNTLKQLFILLLFLSTLTNCSTSSESKEIQVEANNNEASSSIEKSETCEITCPHCGFKKTEILPTEVCQIKYQCENCSKILTPEGDDCCVFCTHSTHKCPSKQQD